MTNKQEVFEALTSFGVSEATAKDYSESLQKLLDNDYTPSSEWECDATGAFKECYFIGPAIIKFATEDNQTSCGEEVIYQEAAKSDIQDIFADTVFIPLEKPLPSFHLLDPEQFDYIIIQEKVETILADVHNIKSPEIESDELEELRDAVDCDKWVQDVIDFYGFNFAKRLNNFIFDQGLYDLHKRNIGYRANGSPVIFDFMS